VLDEDFGGVPELDEELAALDETEKLELGNTGVAPVPGDKLFLFLLGILLNFRFLCVICFRWDVGAKFVCCSDSLFTYLQRAV
jgi:hypothetical protein